MGGCLVRMLKSTCEATVCSQQGAVTEQSVKVSLPSPVLLGSEYDCSQVALLRGDCHLGRVSMPYGGRNLPSISLSRTVGLPWEEVASPSLSRLLGDRSLWSYALELFWRHYGAPKGQSTGERGIITNENRVRT